MDLKGLQDGKQTSFELFFANRNAAALVHGPDLGMELTFPQERQRGHSATQLLQFGAKAL